MTSSQCPSGYPSCMIGPSGPLGCSSPQKALCARISSSLKVSSASADRRTRAMSSATCDIQTANAGLPSSKEKDPVSPSARMAGVRLSEEYIFQPPSSLLLTMYINVSEAEPTYGVMANFSPTALVVGKSFPITLITSFMETLLEMTSCVMSLGVVVCRETSGAIFTQEKRSRHAGIKQYTDSFICRHF